MNSAVIRQEWPTWVLSFLIALGLWTWISLQTPTVVQVREMDLVLHEADHPNVAVASQLPAKVIMRVSGIEEEVRAYLENEPKPFINLKEASEGLGQRFKIRAPDPAYGSVRVVTDPDEWIVDLAQSAAKKLPPEMRKEGELPPDLYLDTPTGLPTEVEVRGPIGQVVQVEKVIYPLQLSGLEGTSDRTVSFMPVDASGNVVQYIRMNPASTPATFSIKHRTTSKRVPVVPRWEGTPAPGYLITAVSTDPDYVEITGSEKSIKPINRLETTPVSVEGLTSSTTVSRVEVPTTDTLVKLSPRNVKVMVTIERIRPEARFEAIPVTLYGQVAGQKYVLSPATISIVVEGEPDDLRAAYAGQFTARLDVSSYGTGTHELPSTALQLSAPAGLIVASQEPATLKLEVTAGSG